jgi:N-methylhydantoinase A/oxoprolinase/acetone carboxylase beta subunit
MSNNQVSDRSAIRIGIDVGGTFTHAVAVDGKTLSVVGRAKVPTTHTAAEGVAKGIIDALQQLLAKNNIAADAVAFIAHSTTQATNALLEGDVAKVGILGIAGGAASWLSRPNMNVPSVELAPGKFLKTSFEFIDQQQFDDVNIKSAIVRLKDAGAQAIAVSQAFAVDDPTAEERAAQLVRDAGLPATTGSEVSKLYGLKIRTRTAVINAAMLPKMIDTANMTEQSVRAAGIKAPIMVMRSDGGVMDIDAMRRRPILTMLSGPAAGVAAAMMYLNISDGIFVEVGGTSTDISVIRNGKALVKSAEVGGHRVYLRTLDVKTVGVAGGSMPRIDGDKIVDVGPRSAHIAGLGYVAFNQPVKEAKFHSLSPKPGDPQDYLGISAGDAQPELTLTPTCAANFIGLVPEGDCASGNQGSVTAAFEALAVRMHQPARQIAETMLQLATDKCNPVIQRFVNEYKLDRQNLTLIGGGGGAAAIVPFMAAQIGAEHKLSENADVVSAIGVALALVRETVERNIVSPTPEDILRIREEAFAAVQRMGAEPSGIEVHIEIDSRASVVRATACGAAGLQQATAGAQTLTEPERVELAARSLKVDRQSVYVLAKTPYFEVFGAQHVDRKLGGLFRSKIQPLRAMDGKGIIRLQVRNGAVQMAKPADADRVILDLAETHSQYGDAGRVIPDMLLLAGPRLVDLSGIAELPQLSVLAREELASVPPETNVIVVASLS